MFRILHPDRGGGPIDSESVTSGRNIDLGTHAESAFIRCKKCGYILNKERHPKGWGVGNSQAYTQLNGAVSVGDTTINVDSTTGFTTPSTGTITAFSESGLGTIVTDAAHSLKGGTIVISATTNYNGTFHISEITTNTFTIAKKYSEDDATGAWVKPEYIYIYAIGSYATSGDVSSAWTAATGEPVMNKVLYTGLTSTTFTGCSGATAHDDNIYVKAERKATGGCALCGTYNYD